MRHRGALAFRPWGRRAAAALLPLLLLACKPAAPITEAHPAMWLVEDADTRIFLLGSMHALPAGTRWDGGKVGAAIAAADELVLELAPDQLAAAGDVFRELAPRSAPLAMERRLDPAALAAYRKIEGTGSGFGGDALDDWAILVLMGQRVAQQADLSPENGVEARLTQRFSDAEKPIGGLETARGQLTLFETLDAATQRRLLTRALANSASGVADVKAMNAAWARGDVAALEKVVNADVDAVPAARAAIITDRNRRWTKWMEQRMAKPGTVLVAVGAGHLVGADGVPAALEAAGYRVVRVQ